MQTKQLDFFLGGLSPTGYAGYYSQVLQNKEGTVVLLKAGPGCGKSTLMKRVAAALTQQGEIIEAIHCSADPASLDGVICPARGIAIIDATAPHVVEPTYPVAFEDVITLYNALQRKRLQSNRAEIIELFNRYKSLQERATRYITAAGSLLQDTLRVAGCCTDVPKAMAFANVLSHHYLPATGRKWEESIRLLSANTLQGRLLFDETVSNIADTIIVVDDPYGAASKVLMAALRQQGVEKGHRFYTCYCSMSPFDKIEHLLFPDLRLAFVTSNPYHAFHFAQQRVIHYTRFSNNQLLQRRRARLRFNKKATQELLAQAADAQAEAKQCHDTLEKYYSENFNFDVLEIAFAQIMNYFT